MCLFFISLFYDEYTKILGAGIGTFIHLLLYNYQSFERLKSEREFVKLRIEELIILCGGSESC